LLERSISEADLARVQKRRTLPVKLTQRMQVFLQHKVITSVLSASEITEIPFPLRVLNDFPLLRRIPGRIIGLGFWPENVALPEVARTTRA
jgi:hypothetical protein